MATMDIDFIKTFALATLETLSVQCNFKAKAGKPFKRTPGQETMPIAIAGVIGMTAKAFRGTIAICFPEATFLKVMGGMLGENFEKMDSDLEEGAGELMNIVFGCAKKSLAEKGHTVERAIPSVLKGQNLQVQHMTNSSPVVIPFSSENGDFQIEIVLEQ